jgi:hypothetical protein
VSCTPENEILWHLPPDMGRHFRFLLNRAQEVVEYRAHVFGYEKEFDRRIDNLATSLRIIKKGEK